jgi:hypothetical protein
MNERVKEQECQEWTPEFIAREFRGSFSAICYAHNTALAAEREKAETAGVLANSYKQEALHAQAAIASASTLSRRAKELLSHIDLSALDKHDEAVRKPLVDALRDCLAAIRHEDYSSQMRACIKGDDALAKVKVKEGKLNDTERIDLLESIVRNEGGQLLLHVGKPKGCLGLTIKDRSLREAIDALAKVKEGK